MPEFGDFGKVSPEEAKLLQRAINNIGSADYTLHQLDYQSTARGAELADDADDIERREHYIVCDPRFETAVRDEHQALLTAVEAMAKYYAAEEATRVTRETLEREASRLLIAANKIKSSDEMTPEDLFDDK